MTTGWLSGLSSPSGGSFTDLINYALAVAERASERWGYATAVMLVQEGDDTVNVHVAFLHGSTVMVQVRVGSRHPSDGSLDVVVWIRSADDIESKTDTIERALRRNFPLPRLRK